MKSIIQQLYDGDLVPADCIIPDDPNYVPQWAKIDEELRYLAAKLPPEDSPRLEQLENRYCAISAMYSYAGFAHGLRLGMRLMGEACTI